MDSKNVSMEQLIPELRQFTCDQLEAGVAPQDLTYALALVATELGMCVTDGSIMVMPTVLKGVSDAVDAYTAENENAAELQDEVAPVVTDEPPTDVVVH
jgi:hypothetical protein